MSDDDIRQDARRLREALGDVEWRAVGSGVRNGDHWYVCENDESIAMIAANDGIDEHLRKPRAEFIAAAPTLVDRLLAELDQALARAEAAEAAIERVREALSGHPRCEKHPDDDVISCGWKRAVRDVHRALDGGV